MEQTDILKAELEHFDEIKDELLKTNNEQYALIKGRSLEGSFTMCSEAYEAGVTKFGTESFLVKQIVEQQPSHQIPALDNCLINVSF